MWEGDGFMGAFGVLGVGLDLEADTGDLMWEGGGFMGAFGVLGVGLDLEADTGDLMWEGGGFIGAFGVEWNRDLDAVGVLMWEGGGFIGAFGVVGELRVGEAGGVPVVPAPGSVVCLFFFPMPRKPRRLPPDLRVEVFLGGERLLFPVLLVVLLLLSLFDPVAIYRYYEIFLQIHLKIKVLNNAQTTSDEQTQTGTCSELLESAGGECVPRPSIGP